jgi:hypothetical protein
MERNRATDMRECPLRGQAEQLLRLRKLPVKEAFCSAGLPSTRDFSGLSR